MIFIPLAITEAKTLVKNVKRLEMYKYIETIVTLGQLKNIADHKAMFFQEEAKH